MSVKLSEDTNTVCKPIDTYEDVLTFMIKPPSWSKYCNNIIQKSSSVIRNSDIYANGNKSNVCHYIVPDKEVPRHKGNLPKTLLCHDMANGYHDDCYINGTSEYSAYNFYNWAAIDIFCYFSHHFISLPPLSWINAAHKHGTQIIGTLITEWHEGAAICKKFLASEDEYRKFADALVDISKCFKLDGWLVNIENDVETPLVLIDFLNYFKNRLHTEIDGSVLIWYDSVTIDGKIHYQNALTERNIEFFMAVDGIFTNYSWEESDLSKSATLADTVGRRLDVFVGVDVWGRNFYGGGQFNTAAALKLVHKHNLSVAIFAQAWTHEAIPDQPTELQVNDNTLQEDGSEIGSLSYIISKEEHDRLCKFNQFLMRDKAFWNSIWPYLNTKGPSTLPFTTSFCRGQGLNRRMCGEIVSDVPWFNLRDMEYQITLAHCPLGYVMFETSTANVVAQKTKVTVSTCNPDQLESTITEKEEVVVKVSKREASESPLDETSLQDLDEDGKTSCMDKLKSIFHTNKKRVKISDSEAKGRSSDSQTLSTDKIEETYSPNAAEVVIEDKIQIPIEKKVELKSQDLKRNGDADQELTNKAVIAVYDVHNDSEIASIIASTIGDMREADSQICKVTKEADSQISAGMKQADIQISEVLKEADSQISEDACAGTLESTTVAHEKVLQYEVDKDPYTSPCVDFYNNDCYNGGGCLIISTPVDKDSSQPDTFSRLFFCEFECDERLIFCYITKRLPTSGEQYLNMCLKFTTSDSNNIARAILVGRDWIVGMELTEDERKADFVLYPTISYAREDFKNIQKHMLLNHRGFYQALENGHDWDVWYYILDYPQSMLREISCKVGIPEGGPILLGQLGVAPYSP